MATTQNTNLAPLHPAWNSTAPVTFAIIQHELAHLRCCIRQDVHEELQAALAAWPFEEVDALRAAALCGNTRNVLPLNESTDTPDTVGQHVERVSVDPPKPLPQITTMKTVRSFRETAEGIFNTAMTSHMANLPGAAGEDNDVRLAPTPSTNDVLLAPLASTQSAMVPTETKSHTGSFMTMRMTVDYSPATLKRWSVLCSGILQDRSIIHASWLNEPLLVNKGLVSLFDIARHVSDLPETEPEDEAPPWWVMDPYSRTRFSWDFIGIVMCMYDLVMVPVDTAFTLTTSYTDFGHARDVISTIFWSLDIVASFATGSTDQDGMTEFNPKKIARNYLRTWFIFDLCIVVADWMLLLLDVSGVSGSFRLGKTFSRILRASKLLRVLKISEKVREVMGTCESEIIFTMGAVTKQIVIILVLCHYFACGWFAIGWWQEGTHTWSNKFINHSPFVSSECYYSLGSGDDEDKCTSDEVFFQYAISLHYLTTLFTLGSANSSPQTALELSYVNVLLLVALLVFAHFISTVSRAIAHMDEVNSLEINQDVLVRRFCAENQVPRHLMARMRRFRRQRIRSVDRRMVVEKDIEIFEDLPTGIRQQLREHRFMRHLLKHPLFKRYADMSIAPLKKLCLNGIEEAFLLPGQEYFHRNVNVNRMIFVLSGKLRYQLIDADAALLPGQWACEEALWSSTSALDGPFVACDASQLMLVVPSSLRAVAADCLFSHNFLKKYAEIFVRRFNEASCEDVDDSDVLFNDPNAIDALVKDAWQVHTRGTSSISLF